MIENWINFKIEFYDEEKKKERGMKNFSEVSYI